MQYWIVLILIATCNLFSVTSYAQCTGGTILNQENFNNGNSGSWTTQDVIGNDFWIFSGNEAEMNGFDGSGAVGEEDWLISPSLDFSAGLDWMMNFEYIEQFSGPDLEVFYSSNYSGTGNPNAATWILLALSLIHI